jgi:hypothetical protein
VTGIGQHIMQQPLLCVSSCRLPLKLSFFVCIAALPWPFSRTSIAARVAASNTSSTPWFSNEEHSKYALAPSALDIRSPYKYNTIDQNKAGGGIVVKSLPRHIPRSSLASVFHFAEPFPEYLSYIQPESLEYSGHI